jgi:hypothetical protein
MAVQNKLATSQVNETSQTQHFICNQFPHSWFYHHSSCSFCLYWAVLRPPFTVNLVLKCFFLSARWRGPPCGRNTYSTSPFLFLFFFRLLDYALLVLALVPYPGDCVCFLSVCVCVCQLRGRNTHSIPPSSWVVCLSFWLHSSWPRCFSSSSFFPYDCVCEWVVCLLSVCVCVVVSSRHPYKGPSIFCGGYQSICVYVAMVCPRRGSNIPVNHQRRVFRLRGCGWSLLVSSIRRQYYVFVFVHLTSGKSIFTAIGDFIFYDRNLYRLTSGSEKLNSNQISNSFPSFRHWFKFEW